MVNRTETPYLIEIADAENQLQIVRYSADDEDILGVYVEHDDVYGSTNGLEVQFPRKMLLEFLADAIKKYG